MKRVFRKLVLHLFTFAALLNEKSSRLLHRKEFDGVELKDGDSIEVTYTITLE